MGTEELKLDGSRPSLSTHQERNAGRNKEAQCGVVGQQIVEFVAEDRWQDTDRLLTMGNHDGETKNGVIWC